MLKFSSETSSDWWFYGVYLRTLAGQFICMDHDSNGKHICIMQKKPALCTYTIIYIYHYIHIPWGWWTILLSEPICSDREWVDWEQMEHKVVVSICSQKTLFFFFCLYSCEIGIQMPRKMKFCMSYWGDTTDDYNSFRLCSVKPARSSIEQIRRKRVLRTIDRGTDDGRRTPAWRQ